MNLLKSHLSRKHHHAPEREGQLCPICGKKCYYTADLEIHIAVQHMGLALERPPKDEGEVMCHECGKVCSIESFPDLNCRLRIYVLVHATLITAQILILIFILISCQNYAQS